MFYNARLSWVALASALVIACSDQEEGTSVWTGSDAGFELKSIGLGPVAPHSGCQGYSVTFTFTAPRSLEASGCTDGTDRNRTRELTEAEQADLRSALRNVSTTPSSSQCYADGSFETLTVFDDEGTHRSYSAHHKAACETSYGSDAPPPFVNFIDGPGHELLRLLFTLIERAAP